MTSILRKYHAYLVGLAERADPVGRQIEMGTQLAPWFAPIIVGAVACFLVEQHVHLNQHQRLVILAPFGAVSVLGMAYVGGVMLIYGARADLSRAKEMRNGI